MIYTLLIISQTCEIDIDIVNLNIRLKIVSEVKDETADFAI